MWSFSLLFLAAFIWSINKVNLTPQGVIDIFRGWPETQDLLARMWPPFIPSEDLNVVAKAVWDTFLMAFAGTFLGLILGIPLGLLAAKNVMPLAFIRFLSRVAIVFARAIPALVFALFFVRVYGIGPLAGILALGLHSIGMIGKLITDAAEEIDSGPREGVTSTGASGFQDTITGVWSQIVPTAIAVGLYRLEICFRSANILGWVGAGGIGVIFRGYQGNLRYQEMLGVTLLITLMVILMELLSAITRHTLLGTTKNTVKKQPILGSRFFSGNRSHSMLRGGHLERNSIGTKLANIIVRKPQPTITEISKLDSDEDSHNIYSPHFKKSKVQLTQPWTSDRVKVNLNPSLKIRGILLTMYDKRNKLSSQVEKEARDYFANQVYNTVIPRNVRLSEAPSHGVPVLIYDKTCPGSKSYFSFTDEFINQEKQFETAA